MSATYGSVLGVVLVVLFAATAEAQTRRGSGGRAPAGFGGSPAASSPYYPGRGPDLYSQPYGRSGTIGPSTPNASGNLGGPGTGGGGGSGG